MSIMIDEAYLTQTLVDLVQIDSRNPSLTPGVPGEAEIGDYIAQALRQLGLDVEIEELAPSRVNVIGTLKGAGNGRSLMLNGHMDTVNTDDMIQPFSGEIRDGNLYGRGALDMKGSLAAMLAVTKAIKESGTALQGDLILTFVADEEHASIGSAAIVEKYRADAVIVTEPTGVRIRRAHLGFIWFEVKTVGLAAHGSRYQKGIDANMRMGRFLAKLDQLEKELRSRTPDPLCGPPSLHAAKLQGGTENSTYASECTLLVEWRMTPGQTEAGCRAELQAIIDALAQEDDTFQATITTQLARPPYAVPADIDIIQTLEGVFEKHVGRKPVHVGSRGWTDAALFYQAGMDAFLFGPNGGGAHAKEEWVDLQSVKHVAAILLETAVRFCGTA
ncbi:MAG: ArgE/DapE family deacylase [Chloroflexota bacterium]